MYIRLHIHEIDTFLTVIKAPVVNMTMTMRSAYCTFSDISVSDNGDGVVYNGTAANGNQVIVEKGLKYYWGSNPENVVTIPAAATSTGDVDRFFTNKTMFYYDNATKPYNFSTNKAESDSLLYLQAYAISKWAADGSDGTLSENATKERLQGTSSVICINTNTGTRVN